MRKTLLLLFAAVLAVGTSSCQKAVLDDSDQSDTKKRTFRNVSLLMDEEFVTISETLMTRSVTEGKVYAVNVYEKKAGAKSYAKYAYGLFTDPSQMNIMLTEGNLYRFECLIVTNNEDAVYHKDGEYLAPFLHGRSNAPTKAENKFVKSTSANLSHITEGNTNLTDSKVVMYPRVYKHYGVVEDFDPSTGTKVTIAARRAVFGLHLVVTPPSEGKLDITYLYNTLTVASTDALYDHASVFSFNQIVPASTEGYEGKVELTLDWEKADGTVINSKKVITIKRNVMTKVAIDVKGPDPTTINIDEEGGQMGNETVKWHVE